MATETRSTIFEIDGAVIRKVERTVLASSATQDFLEALRQTNGISTGLLPPNTIYYYRRPGVGGQRDFSIFVIERPPKVTSVFYKTARRGDSTANKTIKISLPFCLFFIKVTGEAIEQVFPCCSKNKVMNLDHAISVLPLPNIYDRGHGALCTGTISIPPGQPLHVNINTLIMSYFTSEFNMDLQTEYPPCMKMDPNSGENPSIEAWAAKTTENPLFGISDAVTYNQHNCVNFMGMLRNLGWKNE